MKNKALIFRIKTIFFTIIFLYFPQYVLSQARHFPPGVHEVLIANAKGVRSNLLQAIAPIVEKSIADGDYPGAIVLAAHRGNVIYHGTFGNQSIVPNTTPMQFDTIFDIASLTKVVATTPAIMQLIERGKIELDAPVEKYWPAFANYGKDKITIRELLTHTSGLPSDLPDILRDPKKQYSRAEILNQIIQLHLTHVPGSSFEYSDINFIILAHLVEFITGEKFDRYVQNHIFKPLQMSNTFFLPASNLRKRIAPTEIVDDKLRWGEVHDFSAYAMGGIAGNAGLFSTAHDLGLYAQCLIDNGKLPQTNKNARVGFLLGPLTILKMISPQTPAHIMEVRGLGWDIDSAYSSRGILFPVESYGHNGWTGTSMWIDPATQTWLIILTSRVHPKPANNNQLVHDRRAIANIVAASIDDISIRNLKNTSPNELQRAYLIHKVGTQ